jgi:hypothetical protein
MGRSGYHRGPYSDRNHRIPSGNSRVVVSRSSLAPSESLRRVTRCDTWGTGRAWEWGDRGKTVVGLIQFLLSLPLSYLCLPTAVPILCPNPGGCANLPADLPGQGQ